MIINLTSSQAKVIAEVRDTVSKAKVYEIPAVRTAAALGGISQILADTVGIPAQEMSQIIHDLFID